MKGQMRSDSEKPTEAWKGERARQETEAISAKKKNVRLRAKLLVSQAVSLLDGRSSMGSGSRQKTNGELECEAQSKNSSFNKIQVRSYFC